MRSTSGSLVMRWLKRLGLGVLLLVIVAAIGGAIYEGVGRHRAHRDFKPGGALVDIGGGRRIHLDCRGTGSPLVVFQAGLDTMGALSWSQVQGPVSKTTRTCAYDRAGILWSDPASEPGSAEPIARDLHAALAAAGEAPPYVLVGHSLGGPYVMAYTKLYGADVAGVVFVDASHPDQVKRFRAILGKDPGGAFIFKVAAALTPFGVPRLIWPSDQPEHAAPEVRAAVAAYAPMSLAAMLAEADGLDRTLADAGALRTLGDRPLVVLTAMKPLDDSIVKELGVTRETATRFQAAWLAMHDEEAAWSTRSSHRQLTDATHYIQFDRPDAVIEAVNEVVGRVRSGP